MAVREFTSVAVGAVVPAETVSVTRERLLAYAAASGDHNRIHREEEFAKSVGLPDVIAHGMWTMGASAAVVGRWVGDGGRVVSLETRFTKPVVVPAGGAQIEVSAVVKSLDEQARRATLEVTTTADGVKVLGRCLAVVALD